MKQWTPATGGGGSVGRAGAPCAVAVPLAVGSSPPVAVVPVGAPGQSTVMGSGVGLWVLCCGSPLLACVVGVG